MILLPFWYLDTGTGRVLNDICTFEMPICQWLIEIQVDSELLVNQTDDVILTTVFPLPDFIPTSLVIV